MTEPRTPLPGSARPDSADTTAAAVPADTIVEITLVLRRRAEPPADAFTGPPLSRDELAERYGADPADVDAVRAEVTGAGAEVVAVDAAARTVRVRGTVGVLTGLFGTSLTEAASGGRRRTGELSLPAALAGPVSAVLGLDDRPQAEARFRVAAAAETSGFTPLQLAKAYNFPDADGSGQTIAIIELGGGFGQADLDAYFGGLGLSSPKVSAVSVDGGENKPGQDPNGADGEVLLDIEVAGAIAPKSDILVYFAPNTDDGFLDAVTQAAHASPAPAAISISWGQSEDQWTEQARTAFDNACADAALLGVVVTAAAGDSGSSDNATDSAAHVDFPSSSPHVVGCGGTSLTLDASGAVATETVWNNGADGGATGGGISDAFPVPDWQASAGLPSRVGGGPGRGVPDVAAVADPRTGYQVIVDGKAGVIGGTSAVSPLMAGLAARFAQLLDRPLGLVHPTLYAGVAAGQTTAGLRDITEGSNGAYTAGPGWDACTGLGVVDGTALLERVRGE